MQINLVPYGANNCVFFFIIVVVAPLHSTKVYVVPLNYTQTFLYSWTLAAAVETN